MGGGVAEEPARGGARRRLKGLIVKEFLQIVRDPSSIAIAFVMPVVLLLIFGYGVSLDAKRVPVAVVIDSPSAETAAFVGSFGRSDYLIPVRMASMRQAEAALVQHRVDGVVRLPSDFAARLGNGRGARIQVIVNGVDGNKARIVKGYMEAVWSKWLAKTAATRASPELTPVRFDSRIWFNANTRSRDYLVPGLIAVIMTLIGAMLTALVVAREWERGTMEALMVTPVAMGEVLLGKLVPYFVLGMGGMALSVAMALWLFGVPLRGSAWVLYGVAALFMLVALGMGLLISVVSRNQYVAGTIAIVVTFLPAFLLSGFIFDLHSVPPAVQWLTRIVPARYFVSFLQTIFLAGNVWSVILTDAAALCAMAVVLLGITVRKSRKRLD